MHKDELNMKYLVNDIKDPRDISILITKIRIRIKEEGESLTEGDLNSIMANGGFGIGGLTHIEGRIFNHALGSLIEPEYRDYHLRSLKECIRIFNKRCD